MASQLALGIPLSPPSEGLRLQAGVVFDGVFDGFSLGSENQNPVSPRFPAGAESADPGQYPFTYLFF